MRAMTKSEQLVGRRLPGYPSHFDTYLARYVKLDGALCLRMTPNEPWLRPAHTKARRSGLVRFTRVSFGRGAEMWELTETGAAAAREAAARVRQRLDERAAWGRDCAEAFWAPQDPPQGDIFS